MTDNTKNTINNPDRDPNQLSDDELNAVNGGITNPVKKVAEKINEKINDYVKKNLADQSSN